LKRASPPGVAAFPFSVPAIQTLPSLDLSARVTCFVGENGSGKSTLLEGIAAAASLPTVGATEVTRDGTLAAQRLLTAALRLTWAKRTHRGFFLRAEDFFGFQRRLPSSARSSSNGCSTSMTSTATAPATRRGSRPARRERR